MNDMDLMWTCITIALVGVASLALSSHLKRTRGKDSVLVHGLRDLAISLWVAVVVIAVIERRLLLHQGVVLAEMQSQQKTVLAEVKARQEAVLAEVKAHYFPAELRALVGSEIGDEIEKQIVRLPFRYSDYEANLKLETVGDAVTCIQETRVTIHNAGGLPEEWLFRHVISDLVPGQEVQFRRLQIELLDHRGGLERMLCNLDGNGLRDCVQKGEGGDRILERRETLLPDRKYRITISKQVPEDLHGSSYHRVRYACNGLRLNVTYDPARLNLTGDFLYPVDLSPGQWSKKFDGGFATLQLQCVALPHQGIYVEWSPVR